MSDLWEQVREAIADKVAASAGVKAAGLRRSDTRTDDRLSPPQLLVLRPLVDGEIARTNANREDYDLRIPAELLVARPAGKARSAPTVSGIVRAIQIEWRTGITLGMAPTVSWSYLEQVTTELEEFADTDLDGARLEFVVRVSEVFTPARTS